MKYYKIPDRKMAEDSGTEDCKIAFMGKICIILFKSMNYLNVPQCNVCMLLLF